MASMSRRLEPRIGDRRARRLQRQRLHAASARLGIVGLADADDAGAVAQYRAGRYPLRWCPPTNAPVLPKARRLRSPNSGTASRPAQHALHVDAVAQKRDLLLGRRRRGRDLVGNDRL